MGNFGSSYLYVSPGSLLGLSCKMVVQDPLASYIQVSHIFLSNIISSLQVSSPSWMGAIWDLGDGIFFSWSRLIIEYVFHKVYFMLDEGTRIGSNFCGLSIQSFFHVSVERWKDQAILMMPWSALRASCRCPSVDSVAPPNLVISMGDPNCWAAINDRCTILLLSFQ